MRSIYGMDLMAGDCFQRQGDPTVYHVRYQTGADFVVWPACIHQAKQDESPTMVLASDELYLLTEEDVLAHKDSARQVYFLATQSDMTGQPGVHNWMANGRYSKHFPPAGGPQWVRETNV